MNTNMPSPAIGPRPVLEEDNLPPLDFPEESAFPASKQPHRATVPSPAPPKHIRIIAASNASAETEFDKLVREGWTLVTCWPENDQIHGVFQRAKANIQSLPKGPDLNEIVEALLAEKPKKEGYPHSLSVATLAKRCKTETEDMLAHLRSLGLQSVEDDKDNYNTQHNQYNIFLKKDRKWGHFYINLQSEEDFEKSPINKKHR